MADEFHCELRHSLRVPLFFEGENRQEQIIIASHLAGTAFARSPDLGRNVLNDFRVPALEPAATRPDMLFHRVSKTTVEAGKIHADDSVRLPFQSEVAEALKQAVKFWVISHGLEQADDGMRGHVEGEINSRRGHARSSGAEEPRFETGVEWLVVGCLYQGFALELL